jgi:hypothetical protein
MANSTRGIRCTFKHAAWLDSWLKLIPYRGEAGRLVWRQATETESYLAAVAFVIIATAVRVAVDRYVFGAQFSTFTLAVMVSTFVGGTCVGKDGSTFPARIHNTSVRGDDGELRYRVATVQDITERRRAAKELRQWQINQTGGGS